MTESAAVGWPKPEVGGPFTSNIKQKRVRMLVAAVQSATLQVQVPDATVCMLMLFEQYDLPNRIHNRNEKGQSLNAVGLIGKVTARLQ